MERVDFFTNLKALVDLRNDTTHSQRLEFMDSRKPDARTRIENISRGWPSDHASRVSSVGGNSNMYTMIDGVVEEYFVSGTIRHSLNSDNFDLPTVVIYPFGITSQLADGRAVFEHPDTARMRSIALECDKNKTWLERRVEPLFNIDKNGAVYTNLVNQPTAEELELLDNILEQFESATSSR